MRSPKWPQNKKRSRLGYQFGVQLVYLAARVFHFEAILAWTSRTSNYYGLSEVSTRDKRVSENILTGFSRCKSVNINIECIVCGSDHE